MKWTLSLLLRGLAAASATRRCSTCPFGKGPFALSPYSMGNNIPEVPGDLPFVNTAIWSLQMARNYAR